MSVYRGSGGALLYQVTGTPAYRQLAQTYAQTAWTQDRQPGGLISDPDPHGGEAPVNQTAPMAELYALPAGAQPLMLGAHHNGQS